MTWTKLGSEWPDEARSLSSDAYRLHVDALCFCNRLLSDLTVRRVELPRVSWLPEPDKAADELVRAGWWESTADGWYIGARFPAWQKTKAQVEARREIEVRSQRKRRASIKEASTVDTTDDSTVDDTVESPRFSERNGTVEKSERSLRAVSGDWPVVHRCSVCHGVLDVSLGSTHPTCGES